MKLLEWKKLEPQYKKEREKEMLLKILLMLIILVIVYFIITLSYSEFELLFLEDDMPFYLKENNGKMLIFFTLSFWLYFLMAAFQFVLNFSFKLSMDLAVKSGLFGFSLMVIGIIPFNIYTESSLKQKGYSYCNWYTGASFRAPDVWLKNDELCLKEGSIIISEVDNWFNEYSKKEAEPNLTELKAFIEQARLVKETKEMSY